MRRAIVVAVVLLGGCAGTDTSAGPTADPQKAARGLDGLKVSSERNAGSYERDKFGQRWKDTDRNGCDQRNDVLARDLDEVRKQGRCVVVAGTLHDPYTGKDITFRKADAADVQIDHIYPLALAWRLGASQWSEDRREQFANDKVNLLAVWGRPNQQKGDSGPSEWKPQKSYQCSYAAKYIAVAEKYDLPVTRADHSALDGLLSTC